MSKFLTNIEHFERTCSTRQRKTIENVNHIKLNVVYAGKSMFAS